MESDILDNIEKITSVGGFLGFVVANVVAAIVFVANINTRLKNAEKQTELRRRLDSVEKEMEDLKKLPVEIATIKANIMHIDRQITPIADHILKNNPNNSNTRDR